MKVINNFIYKSKKRIKQNYFNKIKNMFIIINFTILFESNIFIKKTINNIQPKISIFLPIYNKASFLKRSIRSIQKQTLKNIEIIPVNDLSEDNSLEILKKMAKKDSRIKIINNDRNRGLLYSRAMGILNSKGEYIMNLDPDDELSNSNNLKYLYNKIIKFKIDIISFGIIIKTEGVSSTKLCLCSNFKKIQYQPKLFQNNSEIFDYLITNKLVKNELFKNVSIIIKEIINKEKWNYGEDEIWSILINKYALSKLCIQKYIYIYNTNKYGLTRNSNNILYIKNILNWIHLLKKILIYENENIYLNRFKLFCEIIEINYKNLVKIKKYREIKYKYFNIFRNISFKINIKNSTLIIINESLKK